jgi:hypothetical protein
MCPRNCLDAVEKIHFYPSGARTSIPWSSTVLSRLPYSFEFINKKSLDFANFYSSFCNISDLVKRSLFHVCNTKTLKCFNSVMNLWKEGHAYWFLYAPPFFSL